MRSALLGAALLTATALAATACSDDGAGTASASGRDRAPTTSTTLPGPGVDCRAERPTSGTFAVGRRVLEPPVDPARSTDPEPGRGLPGSDRRELDPTVVLYPAEGPATAPGAFTDSAPPAEGRFPLVVYSHGVSSEGTERNDALARWARAGYVVVAPTFPLSSGPGALITDLPNQPGDVEFLLDHVAGLVEDPEDPLHDRVLTDCVALTGHSLGAATTLATTYDPCCGPENVRAAVALAGVLIKVTPDADWSDAPDTPLLVVHGERDPTLPVAQALRTVQEVPAPAWLLTLRDGDHNSLFVEPQVELVGEAVVAFLDDQLKGDPTRWRALPDAVARTEGAALVAAP